MGHVNVQITISNPIDPGFTATVDALVDTGATFTVVPVALATQLRLPITEERRVRTATGVVTLELGSALVQINGKKAVNPILISKTLDRLLIGVITLESLSLTVDPTKGVLNEAEALLFYAR